MTKLTDVKGRIYYISSPKRQENLYSVYETTDRKFWTELQKYNQEEFTKSGTAGKCIEARELIIALPESFVDYDPKALLKIFTEHFKQTYGTDCIAALHHNKPKTNYHIHLIFSERQLLEQPENKIATRNMFYDEEGKHVRTKKEILDAKGQIRIDCKIIEKGEVYERNIFTIKDSRFKNDTFLDEVKRSYTNLINLYVRDDKDKLKVFDRNGVYLPMKKIGKNNPKEEQIIADNQMRSKWNAAVDRALVSGVPESQIMDVKRAEITQKASQAIKSSGKCPEMFAKLIQMAIYILELMISKILIAAFHMEETTQKVEDNVPSSEKKAEPEPELITITSLIMEEVPEAIVEEELEKPKLERPVQSVLAAKYIRLAEVDEQLMKQNRAIYRKEEMISELKEELAELKGLFKGKQRSELEEKIQKVQMQMDNMKKHLSDIVKPYGYQNVKEFYTEFKASKMECDVYQRKLDHWMNGTVEKSERVSIVEKLQYKREEVRNYEQGKEHTPVRPKDRCGR